MISEWWTPAMNEKTVSYHLVSKHQQFAVWSGFIPAHYVINPVPYWLVVLLREHLCTDDSIRKLDEYCCLAEGSNR